MQNAMIHTLTSKSEKSAYLLGIASGAILGLIELAQDEGATKTLESLKVLAIKLNDGIFEIFYKDSEKGEQEC